MEKRFLIRADDLGYSKGTNYGIAETVRHGIIKTVGLMPNMPDASHGVGLLSGMRVCYGQHTNICVGKPLTNSKKIPSITQENGEFKTSKMYRDAAQRGEDFVVLDEVVLEIEAQYQEFVRLIGQEPSYFECHAISSPNFYKGLEIVAKKHGVDYLQIAFDKPFNFCGHGFRLVMEVGMPGYNPFETLRRGILNGKSEDIPMMVCHPGYLDSYILRTSSLTMPRVLEVEMACSVETRRWLEEHKIQLITYDDLKA